MKTDTAFTLTLWGDFSPGIGIAPSALQDPHALYAGLYPVLQRADLNLLNLEGVFTPTEAPLIVKDGQGLRLPPAALRALAPFRMVCLANNHIMDYGLAGLRHTLEQLRASGIAWTGIRAPQDAPRSPQAPLPEWLHILNAAEGEEARAAAGQPGANPLEGAALCAEVRRQRQAGRQVVVIVHAGREHLCIPAPYMRRTCRALAEAGAALVVGHHPHVPQGMETWHGASIAYSLGNFALYPESGWRWHRLGYGLEVRFRSPQAAPQVRVHPYEITPTGLQALRGEAARRFIEHTLPALSAPIQQPGRLEALWDAYVDDFLQRQGLEEILGALGALGGTRWATATLWGAAATRMPGSTLQGRVFRRLLRVAVSLLGQESPQRAFTPEAAQQAAVLRNRLVTPAHREVWLHGLGRMMDGSFGSAPAWAVEALHAWRLR